MRSLRVAAAGLLVSGLMTLGACAGDATAPVVATIAPPAATPAVTGAPTGAVTAEMNTGLCLDVWLASTAPGAPVKLSYCHGGANQQWTATAAGELRIYDGSLCLDADGGQGHDGDQLIVHTCHGGANQKWEYTAAGELRGINGKCVDIWGADAYDGVTVALYLCHGGANQRWNAPTTPTHAPAPSPAPTDGAAKVFALMGSVPSVAAVEALGGAFARYEQDFRTYGEQRWSADGVYYDPANYYDRAAINYVWWARTGNQTYLDRANALALDYRQNYLAARDYPVDPYMLMLDGVALHYLVTGDAASQAAIGRVADRMAVSGHANGGVGRLDATDNRDQSRVLMTFVLANYVRAPSAAGHDWAAKARAVLPMILSTQSDDGAYRFTIQCGYNKPWMVGILNDALIRYHALVEADGRIVPAVKKALDYMWANDWIADSQAFSYEAGNCDGSAPGPAGDLTNLVSSGFGFVYKMTGDATYRTRGDAVFAGGVSGAWFGGAKHFNQAYANSYRYLDLRQ